MNKLTLFLLGILTSQFSFAQPLNSHLLFDGVDDYISLNNIDVSGSAITLEALFNSSNLNNCTDGQCRIISKAISPTGSDHYWMLSTNTAGGNTTLRFRLKANGITTTQIATLGLLSDNTWYHVAATYDGASMKIFLDGTLVDNTPKTGVLSTNATVNAWIGGNPPAATGHPWQGGIDEVRIWNTARTQAQIQASRNTELTGNEPGLQAYYQFNEGTGQTVNDAAGNNNTVLGSTSSSDTNDPTFSTPNPNPRVTFNLKVFLEGPYDQGLGSMTSGLLQRSVVPQGQPYADSPWNYPGTEGTGWLPTDYPVGTVDWVLVSLRETLDPATEVAQVAAVLLQNGNISTFDLNLNNNTGPLYVMIEHRNHLPIISAQPVPIINNTLSFDFTAQNSYNPTGFGQKQVGSNWMMYGGNADQVGLNGCDINAADRIFWQTVNGQFGVYNPGDYDLDGDINAADRIVFSLNNGIFTTIPKSSDTADVPKLVCPSPNFVLDTCAYTVSWTHANPLSTTVNYDLRINGLDPSPSVTYPATSLEVDICSLLGITTGTGSIEVKLLYWYDGDLTNIDTAGVCMIDYNFQSQPPSNRGLYEIDPTFNVANLPTATMQQAHADWWTGYQSPNNLYQTSPAEIFAPADINNWKSCGTYSICREGSHFLVSLTDLIRTTGDPNALAELILSSQQIRSNLKDHDGRGYDYFEYTAVLQSNPVDNRHNLDDTQWLDEIMLSGVLSHIAYVMHLNRNLSVDAAVEADFWFKYLDENWIPKWLYRTTYGTSNEVTPAANLGLQNAVNWNGGVGGSGGNAGDIVLWGGADAYDSGKNDFRFNDEPGIVHEFPAHHFGHSYIMGAYTYLVMGRYFTDMGLTPKGAYLTGTAQDYINEAQTRHDWWYKKVITRPDGSLEWSHFIDQSKEPMLEQYSQYVTQHLTLFHWLSFGNFGNDSDMEAYAKVLYSGNPSDATDVYDPGNITTMKRKTDGSGGDINFIFKGLSALSCWDQSGTLLSLNNQLIVSPTNHHINGTTYSHHLLHYNTILSCEYKDQ